MSVKITANFHYGGKSNMSEKSLNFLSPIDGDVVFEELDGVLENGVLTVPLTLSAKENSTVMVNGITATETEPGVYSVQLPINAYRTEVCATCQETAEEQKITLFWFKGGYKTYRIGVDDVIMSLQNIYNHRDEYKSIFEDPFFALYRELHDKYGTHTHMHIYYETVDKSFNLSMFPDTYKQEFIENSHWLRLSFHATADLPNNPYKNASYEAVMEEGKRVADEIIRFAGPEVMDRVTSQHWADSALPGTRAFRDLGYTVLDAYFLIDKNGDPAVSYYLNAEQTRHAQTRDFWVDTKENIIFVKDDIILNKYTADKVKEYLDGYLTRPDRAFMYLLIHEQYFYPDYAAYLPDYKERLFAGVEWCEEHGYRPSLISDFAFGDNEF